MKKLDKLVIKSFIGPFFLTFFVVVFILLVVHITKYFDELVGKDLGIDVFVELFFYFGLFNTPAALPLAILLSSLMTFGNLGEHFELTAVKSAGVSLIRIMMPIFIFVVIITVAAFYSNNYLVPQAALNAYSLIYDIRQKKPALDIKAGTYYNGIPNYSIKVKEKSPDGKGLKDLIIYNHADGIGNVDLTLADSGTMYTFLDDRYLKFELYNGTNYREAEFDSRKALQNDKISPLTRTHFDKSEMIFDLSSFDLKRTRKELFSSDRLTRNYSELAIDVDSIYKDLLKIRYEIFRQSSSYFLFHFRNKDKIKIPATLENYKIIYDSLQKVQREEAGDPTNLKILTKESKNNQTGEIAELSENDLNAIDQRFSSLDVKKNSIKTSLNITRQLKNSFNSQNSRLNFQGRQYRVFQLQKSKMITQAIACITMFLIGAPLGAIIKRGGLGVPVIISILFFIIFYVTTITGEKWIKQDSIEVYKGVWMANAILFPIGLFFLRQARADARLFDADFYLVIISKVKNWYRTKQLRRSDLRVDSFGKTNSQ